MASFVIRGHETTRQELYRGETGLVKAGASLIVAEEPAVVMSETNTLLTVLGIVRASFTGFRFGDAVVLPPQDSGRIVIGATGSILSDYQTAIVAAGDVFSLDNAGLVQGQIIGLSLSGPVNFVINSGTIEGNDTCAILSYSDDFDLSNSGIISGPVGLYLRSTGVTIVDNSGLIEGSDYAIFAEFYGLCRIVNSGQIAGIVSLGGGADRFVGLLGSQSVIRGNGGDDFLKGGAGGERLSGGEGADFLSGASGDDVLLGGSGADYIVGGRGNDILYGGSGRDQFKFGPTCGTDTVKDFKDGVDQIDLNQFGFATAAEAASFAIVAGEDVEFHFAGGGVVTLSGVAPMIANIEDWIIF